jgi:uncharacterized protein (TIGR00730 family)
MRSVAVFCGSNFGAQPTYAEGARELGAALASRALTLIYGGTHKGLMGVLADAVLGAGGNVTGIITQRLADHGHSHPRLSTIEIVADMVARKFAMSERADAFVVLPGGVGTLEELFEVWTYMQIEGYVKPIGLLDVSGYFAPLLACVEHMVSEAFLPASHRDMLIVERHAPVLLDRLAAHTPVISSKWL